MALTYSEQILLLAWDEQAGTLRALPELAIRYALAGAVLLELALAGRIDMDPERLHLVDAQPTGDPLLDDILRRMGATGEDRQGTADWLNTLAWQTPDLQQLTLQRLVDKGVLRIEDQRILWVFTSHHYQVADDRGLRGLRLRLQTLIDSDEIPDPDEAVLVALVDAFGLFDELFSPDELTRRRPRIEAITRLDLIGREVTRTLRQVVRAVHL
jgi:golgi phosphoprotein 3